MRFAYAQERRLDPAARPPRAGADHSLSWNSWIVPTSKGVTYYPTDVDPRSGKSIGQNAERTHDSWLREYSDWLQKNYGVQPPEEDDFVGSTAIGGGWIRKAGFDRYLTYTISPENAGRSLRHIKDNLWDHVTLASSRRMDLSSIPVVIAILQTPTEMPTAAEFTLQDFVDDDGDIASIVRHYQALRRTGLPEGGIARGDWNIPPPSRARSMAAIATEMEWLGHHDLADRMDGLIRTAQAEGDDLPSDVSRRWRSTRNYYEPFRRSIIPISMASERMLAKNPDEYSAAQRALSRWGKIINDPRNVDDLAHWIARGDTPLGAIEEERLPGLKFHQLTGAWAMEDTMMDPLARRLQEPGLVHHSPIDRDRQLSWYERKMGSGGRGDAIEADFRSTAPGPERLYELKNRFHTGPFEIGRNIVPKGRARNSVQLLVQRLNDLGRIDPRTNDVLMPSVGQVEMFAPSWRDVESAPLNPMGRSHILDPRDPMASARIDREEIEEVVDELHGGRFVGRGKHAPQWNADLDEWAENVLGRVRKLV
jgi:hypothetical protein